MDWTSHVSNFNHVKSLENDLDESLRDLHDEIEETKIFSRKSDHFFSSFDVPCDPKFYQNERVLYLKNLLKVDKAHQLTTHPDIITCELKSVLKNEYSKETIALILHEFYVSRAQELLICKHAHMQRWSRFCEHTKVIEKLYPHYSKRLREIIEDYQDCVVRAERLSRAREAFLCKKQIPTSIVREDDLIIYTRWLITHLHATKKINCFVKNIQWINQSHLQFLDIESPNFADVAEMAMEHYMPKSIIEEDIIEPSLKKTSITSAFWKNAFDKITCSKKKKLTSVPEHSTNLTDISDQLDDLLEFYKIDMRCCQVENLSDEVDMFNLALRVFKKVHFKQEQERIFPVYQIKPEQDNTTVRNDELKETYKQESNWIPYIQIKPDIDADMLKVLTNLKEQSKIDELLIVYSRFFHVTSNETVLRMLREHMKRVEDQQRKIKTYVIGKTTKNIWKEIFDSSFKAKSTTENILHFDETVMENKASNNSYDYDLNSPADNLGLKEDNSKKNLLTANGAYMSYLVLRHLKIKHEQAKCLSILNYFRSIERMVTINLNQLMFKKDECTGNVKAFQSSMGKSQYIHNSPVDYVISKWDMVRIQEIDNHDDYYMTDDGDIVRVYNTAGPQIMYDVALKDFSALEEEMLLICTEYILKKCSSEKKTNKAFLDADNMEMYGGKHVDRFAILLDLWSKLSEFLTLKKLVVDCYVEIFHHIFDIKDKEVIAKFIATTIWKKPRIDLTEEYFMHSLIQECKLQISFVELLKYIINEQVTDQREYIQRLYRDDKIRYGFPLKVIPIQNIMFQPGKVNTCSVYMLEFHPSLALLTSVVNAINESYTQLVHMYNPKSVMNKINLEVCLVKRLQKVWIEKQPIGDIFSTQIKKDLFSDIFVDDAILVCDVIKSLYGQYTSANKPVGSISSMKEESEKMIAFWCKALEVLCLRHRLLTDAHESSILLKIYEGITQKLGQEECHAYMRPLLFDFAVKQTAKQKLPLSFQQLIDDESNLDRYIPSQAVLDVMELDEKDSPVFTFRNQDGLLNLLNGNNIEKLKVTLMCQIIGKHFLRCSVLCIDSSLNIIRSELKENYQFDKVSNEQLNQASLVALTKHTSFLTSNHVSKDNVVQDLIFKKLFACFVSLQPEKSFYRDKMISQFLILKEKKQVTGLEEINQLKRTCIKNYCQQMNIRISQHALRSQIIGQIYSLQKLLKDFPATRDAHFVFGTESDQQIEHMDVKPVQGDIRQRPKRLLSIDGKLLNLWYIPYYVEVMEYGKDVQNEICNNLLYLILRLMSSLHEITEYLCAHARSGSGYARMGSQKVEYNGITADWGGTEGIGAELREIQKQIDALEDSSDSAQVASFLEQKRDLMYLHYKVAVDISTKETFLEAKNIKAFEVVNSVTDEVFSRLSDKRRIWSNFSLPHIPDVLKNSKKLEECMPWRYFISRYGYECNGDWQDHRIGYYVNQSMAGLSEMDKHIVHGEILGVSLILEDIMSSGEPQLDNIDISLSKRSNTSLKNVKSNIQTSMKKKPSLLKFSWHTNPLPTVSFLNNFLRLCCQLENLKRAWIPLRMNISSITTLKSFESFKHIYKSEVTQAVLNHFTEVYNLDSVSSFKEFPSDITEYELKLRETSRLIENFICLMISETINKISRDHTAVLNEKNHVQNSVPTDIWKTPAIKSENFNFLKDKSIEDFINQLDLPEVNNKAVTINIQHLEECIKTLGIKVTKREKEMFLNYSSFYENLLRKQNHIIFAREQEVKALKSIIDDMQSNSSIDIDCGLAERTHDLLIEVSALRSKLNEYELSSKKQEETIQKNYKAQYNNLVLDLFNNAFGLKERFEQYRFSLYDDTKNYLTEIRKLSSEKFKDVHQKHFAGDTISISQRLLQSQKLRDVQLENSELKILLSKLRYITKWNRVSHKSNFSSKVSELEREAAEGRKEYLEKFLVYEDKESLQKEEQDALRKLITGLEKESENLKKQLQKEQKLKAHQSHTLLKEVQSLKHLDFAKSSNVEKISAELELKEKELQLIKSSSGNLNKLPSQNSNQTKRLLNQTIQQVEQERMLKLSAFERVDELQKQVNELEMKVLSLLQKDSDKCRHASCFPVVSGGRTSPVKQKLFSLPNKLNTETAKRPLTSFGQRPKSGLPSKSTRPHTVTPRIRAIRSEIPLSRSTKRQSEQN